jgi:hypothetical protein
MKAKLLRKFRKKYGLNKVDPLRGDVYYTLTHDGTTLYYHISDFSVALEKYHNAIKREFDLYSEEHAKITNILP